MIADSGLPLARRRLRWRARRGLLENDWILSRFLERHGDQLTSEEVVSFGALLDLRFGHCSRDPQAPRNSSQPAPRTVGAAGYSAM